MFHSTKIVILLLSVVTLASVAAALHRPASREYDAAGSDNNERYDVIRPAQRLASYRKQAQAEDNAYPAPAPGPIQKLVSIGEEYNHPAPVGVRKPVSDVEDRVYHAPPARKPVSTDYSYSAPAAPARKQQISSDESYSYTAPSSTAAPARKPAAYNTDSYSYSAPAAPVRKPVASADSYNSYSAPAAPARKPVASADSYNSYSAQARKPLSAEAAREDERITLEQNSNAHYSFASAVNDGIQDQSQVRKETRDGLKVAGEYSYSDGFVRRTVKYEADENGYRVVSESQEPIEGGPQVDLLNGKADVHTQVEGIDTVYSISAHDIMEKESVAAAPQVAKPKSHLRHKEADSWEE